MRDTNKKEREREREREREINRERLVHKETTMVYIMLEVSRL